jgi:hypothetical protein
VVNIKSISEKFKPVAPKKTLLIIAGTMWFGVGGMLVFLAVTWLNNYRGNPWFFVIPGFIASLLIHHFGFLKIVDKNLNRISRLPVKPCIFSFISWKSYLIIIIMITMGITLRHSAIPKQYLSIIYLGIGLALFFSSIRYFRNILLQT